MAPALTRLRSVREIQQELLRLREAAGAPGQAHVARTSVMTHIAWVPADWRSAALQTLAGLEEQHPSRTILLFPEPLAGDDAFEAEVEVRSFGSRGRQVSSEVISIWLNGRKASVPGSVVLPLLRSDLPVFLRWRGALPLGTPSLDQLVAIATRLIVDSGEWRDVEGGLHDLPALFDRIAVSDIAWARTEAWREALAALWPGIATAERVRVVGPRAEAVLLAGWLRTRLGRSIALEHVLAEAVSAVDVDGVPARPLRPEPLTSSELLSHQLEIFTHDPIYERAVLGLHGPSG